MQIDSSPCVLESYPSRPKLPFTRVWAQSRCSTGGRPRFLGFPCVPEFPGGDLVFLRSRVCPRERPCFPSFPSFPLGAPELLSFSEFPALPPQGAPSFSEFPLGSAIVFLVSPCGAIISQVSPGESPGFPRFPTFQIPLPTSALFSPIPSFPMFPQERPRFTICPCVPVTPPGSVRVSRVPPWFFRLPSFPAKERQLFPECLVLPSLPWAMPEGP